MITIAKIGKEQINVTCDEMLEIRGAVKMPLVTDAVYLNTITDQKVISVQGFDITVVMEGVATGPISFYINGERVSEIAKEIDGKYSVSQYASNTLYVRASCSHDLLQLLYSLQTAYSVAYVSAGDKPSDNAIKKFLCNYYFIRQCAKPPFYITGVDGSNLLLAYVNNVGVVRSVEPEMYNKFVQLGKMPYISYDNEVLRVECKVPIFPHERKDIVDLEMFTSTAVLSVKFGRTSQTLYGILESPKVLSWFDRNTNFLTVIGEFDDITALMAETQLMFDGITSAKTPHERILFMRFCRMESVKEQYMQRFGISENDWPAERERLSEVFSVYDEDDLLKHVFLNLLT